MQTERGSKEHGFITYRADIDGLRAIAVLVVVLYHALPRLLPGGFIGVDVFFVISGYLISGQIVSEIRTRNFSLAAFYGRRIRRIFPALILVLLATLAYGFVILLPAELASLGGDVASGAGFVSNILLWQEAGYFDRAAMLKPLLHLWSLGVEEQFYIVWPLALWLAHRAGVLRAWLLALFCAASFMASVVLAPAHPTIDFYAPFTRLWELGAGALLAWRPALRGGNAFSWAGLLLILGGAAALNAQLVFPGWWALVPVAGAVLLIGAGPENTVNRLLSRQEATYLGRISYPLYLWHWPLISYAHFINNARPLKTFPAICHRPGGGQLSLGRASLALRRAPAAQNRLPRFGHGRHRRGGHRHMRGPWFPRAFSPSAQHGHQQNQPRGAGRHFQTNTPYARYNTERHHHRRTRR
jgi:peptidoglycan/LPS O-acetylase OafA/YrhL